MNLKTHQKFYFLATRDYPGLPLTKDNEIKGFILPTETEKQITRRIEEFLNNNTNENIYSLITCTRDSLRENDLNELKRLLPQVTHIGIFGVGFNHIDVSHAQSLGIRVTNSPGVLAEATADIALTLLLCVTRRIGEGYLMMKETGKYPGWTPRFMLGHGVQNKTLGIVGYGEIGKALTKRATAVGMHCIALESNTLKSYNNKEEIKRLPENEFLSTVDVLSLNCPLNQHTKNWLNKERISRIKQGAVVINTARGELIEEQALAEALNSGHLSGAGLDVFCHEPVLSGHLKTAKNLFILPHLGSATQETREAMGRRVFESLSAHCLERQEMRQKGVLPFQVN